MSGTNASIPLAFNPQPLGPDLGRAIDVVGGYQTLQANQQKMAGQNAIKAIFSNPQNLDASGLPTQNALNQIMAVDPASGMSLMANKQSLYNQQMSARLTQLKIGGALEDRIREIGTDAHAAYQKALDTSHDEPSARRIGQDVLTEGYNGLKSSGLASPEQMAALSPQFDPERTRSNIDFFKMREQEKKDALARRGQDIRAAEVGTQPGRRAEADVEAVADAAIADKNKELEAAGKPPMTQAEEAQQRIQARNAAKPQNAAVISDEAADYVADRFLAGDKTATQGYGRSPANQTKIANAITRRGKDAGMSGADVARKMAEYQGSISAERALGTRTANMEIAANEVKYMAPLALAASEKVDRTQYPTLNSILLAAEKGTGDENVVRFGLAANSLIYTYSKFLNPTGIPTDADKAKATDILATSWSKGQFATAIDQIKKEIASGQQGVASTKEEVGQGISGGGAPGTGGRDLPPAKTEGAVALPTPNARGQYDFSKTDAKSVDAAVAQLPAGAEFIGPDGKTYRKR